MTVGGLRLRMVRSYALLTPTIPAVCGTSARVVAAAATTSAAAPVVFGPLWFLTLCSWSLVMTFRTIIQTQLSDFSDEELLEDNVLSEQI